MLRTQVGTLLNNLEFGLRICKVRWCVGGRCEYTTIGRWSMHTRQQARQTSISALGGPVVRLNCRPWLEDPLEVPNPMQKTWLGMVDWNSDQSVNTGSSPGGHWMPYFHRETRHIVYAMRSYGLLDTHSIPYELPIAYLTMQTDWLHNLRCSCTPVAVEVIHVRLATWSRAATSGTIYIPAQQWTIFQCELRTQDTSFV